MADTRTVIRLFVFLILLAHLAEPRFTSLIYRTAKDTNLPVGPSLKLELVKFRRKHRVKFAVQKTTKHGPVMICLPEAAFVLRPVGLENIIRSGDVHPLPGPCLIQDQQRTSDRTRPTIAYSPSALRNLAASINSVSLCPELKHRLQDLGILRFRNTFTQKHMPIPVISRPCQSRNIYNSRSRNLNNCVSIFTGDYVNSRSCPFVPRTIGEDARSIPVRITPRSAVRGPSKPVNRQRAVKVINLTKITSQKRPNYSFPSFYMANARSVRDKLDELTAQLLTFHMDIAIITETWLHDYIDNNILTIPGYNIARRDRHNRIGGGVCAFVSSEIPFKRRSDLESPEHECLWLWLRPHRLPRPLSGIICGVVYFPVASAQVQRDRTMYIIETLDSVKTSYPDCGVVLLGDFNTQDITDMLANHNLKQVVIRPTRGNSILDLILTDFSEYYSEPIVSAQLGSSDHGSVHWNPLSMNQLNPLCVEKKRIPMRRFPQSAISAFGRWACSHRWFSDLEVDGDSPSVDSLTDSFTKDLSSASDIYFPSKYVKIHPMDKPWMSPEIKALILERQRAYLNGPEEKWRRLRNKVREVITRRKCEFYKNKVNNLKSTDPRKWWSMVNKLAGKASSPNELSYTDEEGRIISGATLASRLNEFFVSVISDIKPLDTSALPCYLPSPQPPVIETQRVYKKLLAISAFKAPGPDGIPTRIWKEYAAELAEPITRIFNTSIASGSFPTAWKDSNVTPVPKVTPITGREDLRPISLTAIVSKVLEDFVVEWLIEDVVHLIDFSQFGCLKGTSTIYCLLDMMHNWLSSIDKPGMFLRACFLDFSKAFDHIDHTILVNKLIHLGVRGFIIRWICSFLYGRRQAVKIKNIVSPWLPVHAGVPQGTKLGPILFLLMINDLAIETPLLSSHWKYVDDLTISEVIPSGGTSSLQKDLDAIAQWSSRNNMNLNPKKCKELVICSLKTRPDLGPLCVNGRPLERVSSHKVLGVTISDTLGWNEHVREIVSKASKRLYILRVLKRSGIPPEDLINIFYALVRSVLEYACVTWSTSLPIYLKDMIERVQKRALRILFPALSYKDAIVAANSTRLNVRRDELCKKVWDGICVPGSRLYHLIPPKRADCHVYELRNKNHVSLFKCRTERFKKSFFPTMASNAQSL